MDKNSSINRNSYIDFLKGISILAVIIGHSIDHIDKLTLIFNFIYSFHMPLLFFTSAYIEEQNRNKYWNEKWKMPVKRIKGLLVPYISWTALYLLTGYNTAGLWFFPVLFGLKIVHFIYWILIEKIKKQIFIKSVVICGLLEIMIAFIAFITKQQYIINIISYAIPYFFAVLLVEYPKFQKIMISEGAAVGAISCYIILFPHFSFANTRWTTQVIRIALSICIIIICCKLEKEWKIGKFNNIICYFGKYSLIIYVMHVYFLHYIGYLSMIKPVIVLAAAVIIGAFIVAFLCTLLARAIEYVSWLSKLLLGK